MLRTQQIALFTLVLISISGVARSDDHLWQGTVDNDFFNSANWDTGVVPNGPEELAVFDEGMNLPVVIPAGTDMVELGGFQLGTVGATGGQVVQDGGTLVVSAQANLDSVPTFYEFKSHIGDQGTMDSSWVMNNDAKIVYDGPIVAPGTGLDTDGVNGFDLEVGARSGAAGATGVFEMNGNALLQLADDLKIGDEDNGNGEVYVNGDAAANIGSGISLSKGILAITGNGYVGTGNSSGPGRDDGRTNEGYLTLSTEAEAVAELVIADNGKLFARTLQQRGGQSIVDLSGNGQLHIFDLYSFAGPDLGTATVTGSPQGPQRTSNVAEGGEFIMTLSENASFSVDSALDANWTGLALSGGTNRGENSGGGNTMISIADQSSFAIQQDLHMTLGTDAAAESTLRITGPDASININGDLGMAIAPDGLANPGSATIHSVITADSHSTVQVGGDAEIEFGSLVVELDGYTPVGNEVYTLISAGEVFGPFGSVDQSAAPLPEGLSWVVDYSSSTEVVLRIDGMVSQICGDFDGDGDVDSADRTIQTTNWTGALPPGDPNANKTFEQGDCDADGDVDTADQNGTITNWTGAMNPAGNLEDGDDANLIYDPVTGNVSLDAADTASGMFISFVLGTGENNMRPENLVESAPGNAGPFFDVGTNTDATTFQIGQTDPLNQGAGPVIDLGNVFPAGITSKEALADYLTLAEYASELGSGGTFDLELVPEPSSLALALIGLLGLNVRRFRVVSHKGTKSQSNLV